MSAHRRRALVFAGLLLSLAAALLLIGAGIGSTGFESVFAARRDPVALQIVWDIRLPRTLGAWLAGALLGLAGAVAQGLFRNPLADPYLLGSASGASMGVAMALVLFGASPSTTQWVVRL
ncbi:MAG: iron ABC transporter permease, partial [Variovorax sp.]